MKALISPQEKVTLENGTVIGDRVCWVVDDKNVYEVASPQHWIDCPVGCAPDEWYYDGVSCLKKPQP